MKYHKQLLSLFPVMACVCAMLGFEQARADAADLTRVAMSAETRQVLQKYCTPDQLTAIEQFLGRMQPAELGPQEFSEAEKQAMAGPERNLRLEPAKHSNGGDGSARAPWEGVFTNFLRQELKPSVTVVVSAGHYRVLDLLIPEGVWLRAEGEVVLHPPPGADGRKPMVRLSSNSGLVGFVLDGSRAKTVDGVFVEERARKVVIARNFIHDIPAGTGISGFRRTAREVQVLGNRVEKTGADGIRTSSDWTVAHNTILYAGFGVRGNQGWGKDGIIAGGRSSGSVIRNNLVISSISTELSAQNRSRHAFGGEICTETTFQANVGIVCGGMRAGLALSDGCDRNRVCGNVLIAAPLEEKITGLGVLINGAENSVYGNAVFGFGAGLHLSSKVGKIRREHNVLTNNYLEASRIGVNINVAGQPKDFDPYKINTITNNQTVIRGTGPENLDLKQDFGEADGSRTRYLPGLDHYPPTAPQK